MTTLTAIVAAIVAALAADLGTIDLSATDQVQEGAFTAPPGSVAFACVVPGQCTDSQGQARNTLMLDTYAIPVRLWAPVTASTAGNRATRARLIADEARAALEAARDTLGNALWKCVRFAVTATTPGPAASTAPPGWAYAELVVTLTFRRTSGTGA